MTLSACSGAACESCSPAGCCRCGPRRGRDRRRVADREHARYDRPVLVAVRAVDRRLCRCRHRGGHAGGAGWPRTAVWLRSPSVAVTLRERGFAQRWRLRSRPTVASRQTRSGAGRHVRSQDVVRVAVEVLAGSVVPHGSPRVGVPSRDLYLAQVDPASIVVIGSRMPGGSGTRTTFPPFSCRTGCTTASRR